MVKKRVALHKGCSNCDKPLNLKKDRYVLLATYQGEKIIEKDFFHIKCWEDYFNIRVRMKAVRIIDDTRKKIMPIFNSPMIKDALSQIKGSDQLMSMASTPLFVEDVTKLEMPETQIIFRRKITKKRNKIQNGRRKKRRSKKE